MFEPTALSDGILIGSIVFLAIMIIFCFCHAIRGPRFTDRVVAINMIGTMTIIIMCILSVLFNQNYLVDIAIVFAMLSFLAVVLLCQLLIVRERRHELEKKTEKEENGHAEHD